MAAMGIGTTVAGLWLLLSVLGSDSAGFASGNRLTIEERPTRASTTLF